jgi:hypothetical protein
MTSPTNFTDGMNIKLTSWHIAVAAEAIPKLSS